MPIPTISADVEFTSMTSKERMEHINSKDSTELFQSKIEYARQEAFKEAKQSVVDTNGRDLDLPAEFFIEALSVGFRYPLPFVAMPLALPGRIGPLVLCTHDIITLRVLSLILVLIDCLLLSF